MMFDTSPPVLATLNESLKNDPGVIRSATIPSPCVFKQLNLKTDLQMDRLEKRNYYVSGD